MSRPKTIDDCTCGKDLERLALIREREGKCQVKYGGRHTKVVTPLGSMPIPTSHGKKQLGKGLLRAIYKQWRLLGLAVLAIIAIAVF